MIHLCFLYRTLFKLWSKSISFVFLLVKWRKNMSLGWRHPCPTHLLVQSTWEISHQSLDFQLINKLILKHFLAQLLFHRVSPWTSPSFLIWRVSVTSLTHRLGQWTTAVRMSDVLVAGFQRLLRKSEEKPSHTLIDSTTSSCLRKGWKYLLPLQPTGTANISPQHHISPEIERHPLLAHSYLLRSLLAAATENYMW